MGASNWPIRAAGTQTFMVFIAADGRLERIDGVLDMEHFARIEPGKSDQSAVLRLLGPSAPLRMQYYRLSNEIAWEWRFCDGGSRLGSVLNQNFLIMRYATASEKFVHSQ